MSRGSLHLVGGGWGGDGAVWRGFLEAAGPHPRVAVLVVRDGDQEEHAAKLVQSLQAAGPLDAVVASAPPGGALPAHALDAVDAVLVGGGETPAYLEAVLPLRDRIQALVQSGRPYAGFSAGTAIAAEVALVGGWRHDGVPVLEEEVGEGLEPVTVRQGLGLTDLTLDVHAAQWGTLARLVTAVGVGLAGRGAAVDEDTALVLDGDRAEVVGSGNVWWAEAGAGGVLVRREAAPR